jgi:hypothetical protein
MEKNGENSSKICLWCGNSTIRNSTHEHIFPHSIGGKKTLSVGSVCKRCPNDLSYLDRALTRENIAIMDAFQRDFGIKGYDRDNKANEEKAKRRVSFVGEGEAKHTRISRENLPDVNHVNPNYIVTSEKFVRALHKCTANVLCDNYGSAVTREKFGDLLKFVNFGGDVRPWSYAVSYPDPTDPDSPLVSEPIPFLKVNDETILFGFIHTSGVWITGSNPFSLNPKAIEDMSAFAQSLKILKMQKPISDFFRFNYENDRATFGNLKFLWIVKEVKGKPDNNFLYLLTKCRICGQTNPTQTKLQRDIIFCGNPNHRKSYEKNTWNSYTVEDLRNLGKGGSEEMLQILMNQGISISIENDVRKFKIFDQKIICINCHESITYSAKDCFI